MKQIGDKFSARNSGVREPSPGCIPTLSCAKDIPFFYLCLNIAVNAADGPV